MAAVAERSHADILPDKPLTHDPLSVTMPPGAFDRRSGQTRRPGRQAPSSLSSGSPGDLLKLNRKREGYCLPRLPIRLTTRPTISGAYDLYLRAYAMLWLSARQMTAKGAMARKRTKAAPDRGPPSGALIFKRSFTLDARIGSSKILEG